MNGTPETDGRPLSPGASGSQTNELAALSSQFTDISLAAANSAEQFARETQADRDRSWIARWVVGAYFASLGAILALLVARAWSTGKWDDAVAQAFEIFKIGILPVVTLVIGHYFGRKERS